MKATEMIGVGDPMPRIAKVVARGGLRIQVTWSGGRRKGTTDVVDLAALINARKIFAPLRDRGALFETVHIEEGGAAIAWGDDAAIEVAATTIERYADAAFKAKASVASA